MDSPAQRPIKVVRIITRLNVGGPAIHVSLVNQRLHPPEFESILLAGSVPPTEGDMSYYAEAHGVQPRYVPEMSREVSLLDDLKAMLALYRILRREKPDVVHTHLAKAGTVGRAAAWLARVPVILHTFHGHTLHSYWGPLKTRIFTFLEKVCAAMSTAIVTISERLREELLAAGITRPEKMHVIELGLELDRFAAAERYSGATRELLGLGREVPLVGFCGRLVPIKNPSLLLAGVQQLHAERPDVHVAIIGDGELRAGLEAEVAERGLGEVVHFLGWQQELPALVADLDLMVLTSHNEGTPVAVIEAAAAGVPAVATRVGGVPDIVVEGETGWLVEPDNAEDLARTLQAALADADERARRGVAAQRRALDHFGADRLAADLAALYRKLLAEKGLGVRG